MVSDVWATAGPPSCTGPRADCLPVEMLLPPVLIHITARRALRKLCSRTKVFLKENEI